MKHSFFLSVILLTLFSCRNTVPRKPVVRKTSSFIKESVSFNKSLIADEEKIFKNIMNQDSSNTYISSPNGFWYKFDTKNSNSYLPKFGDILVYTYEVFDVNNR